MSLALLLLACAAPPLPDAQLYLAAVEGGALSSCAPIVETSLREECTAMLARDLARSGDIEQALAACAAMGEGTWRDECFFLLSDASASSPSRVHELCDQAGRFRSQCVGHAISRAMAQTMNTMEPGDELVAMAALDEAVRPFIWGDAGRKMRIEAVVAKAIALRQPGDHFAAEACGAAPAVVCQKAYAERMRIAVRDQGAPDGAWRRACPPPVTAQRAGDLSLPTWAPELDSVIGASWEELCR